MKTPALVIKSIATITVALMFVSTGLSAGNLNSIKTSQTKSALDNPDPFFVYEGQMGPDFGKFQSIEFDPVNEGTIFSSGYTSRHILKSNDNGSTWDIFHTLPASVNIDFYNIYDLKFINPDEPSHLYFIYEAFATSNTNSCGIYVLDTYNNEIVNIIQIAIDDIYANIASYDVSRHNPDIIVASCHSINYPDVSAHISFDGGESFEMIYNYHEFHFQAITQALFHPDNHNIVFLGLRSDNDNNGGIIKTSNNGASWEFVIQEGELINMVFDTHNSDLAYAVLLDNSTIPNTPKIIHSNDGGNTWNIIEHSIELDSVWESRYYKISLNPLNSNSLWVTYSNALLYSHDGGQTWSSKVFSIDEFFYAEAFDIVFNPFDENHFLLCSHRRVLETYDNGETWEAVSNKMVSISSMTANTFPNGEKYLYYSANGTYSIKNIETDELYYNEEDIIIERYFTFVGDNNVQDRVFIGKSGYGIPGMELYITNDNFQTTPELIYSHGNWLGFVNATGSLLDENIYWFVIGIESMHKLVRSNNNFSSFEEINITGDLEKFSALKNVVIDETEILWAAVSSDYMKGLYKSSDYGSSWTRISNGLPFSAEIRDIAISPFNPNTMLATADMYNGIYMTTNGGEHWFPVYEDSEFSNIAYSSSQEGLVIVQRHDTSGFVFSVDGGYSWFDHPVFDVLDADHIEMVLVDMELSSTIYFSTKNSGIHKYSITMPQIYSLTFNIEDKHGEIITDAVITLNGKEYKAGHYAFDAYPYNYLYAISLEGYEDFHGLAIVSDEDLTIKVVLKEVEEDVNVPDVPVVDLTIYPNPATSQLNIMSGETINEIFVYDLQGRIIYSNKIQSFEYTFNVSSLNNGMYFIRILTSGNNVTTRKFQVNK